MENWVIYITKETFCDEGVNIVLLATLSNTVCLFLSLAFRLSNFHSVFANN